MGGFPDQMTGKVFHLQYTSVLSPFSPNEGVWEGVSAAPWNFLRSGGGNGQKRNAIIKTSQGHIPDCDRSHSSVGSVTE